MFLNKCLIYYTYSPRTHGLLPGTLGNLHFNRVHRSRGGPLLQGRGGGQPEVMVYSKHASKRAQLCSQAPPPSAKGQTTSPSCENIRGKHDSISNYTAPPLPLPQFPNKHCLPPPRSFLPLLVPFGFLVISRKSGN